VLVALAAAAEATRLLSARAAVALTRVAAGAFRAAEARAPSGAATLAVGYALAWWLFPPTTAEAAIVVTALADPAAAVVGSRFGHGVPKSVAGSLACACTAAVALAVLRVGAGPLVAASVGAAVAERVPWRAADNVAVPLVVGALLLWIR
jgi:dolichol kinase